MSKQKRKREPERKLYLAFGSNLHKQQMRQRCPTAVSRGKLMLDNARLVFRGVADVIYEPGSQTPVGVWEISEDDERRLDTYEGVAQKTYSKFNIWIGGRGRTRRQQALIYTMNDAGIYPPSAWYAGVIRRGYRHFGLDERFLNEAILYSFDQKAPSQQTRERRKRQRAGDVQRELVALPEEFAFERARRQQEALEQRLREEYDAVERAAESFVMPPHDYQPLEDETNETIH